MWRVSTSAVTCARSVLTTAPRAARPTSRRRFRVSRTTLRCKGRRRRRCLETDGHEDDLAVGLVQSQLQGVHGGVDDPDVGPRRLGIEKRALAARDAQHVAETGQRHAGGAGDGDGVVHPPHRYDAHRAAGPVHQFDRGREVVLQAVLVDRVGVPAADLHDLVTPAGRAQLGHAHGQGHRLVPVPELVDEAHGG